ncbi:MAG: carbonic anhydrase family protein, partial [Methylotenera sp.]|nr:carbonic anhydrase family protein [Methylotenera sp.]
QSILQKDNLKRAWVKIEYKTPQKNPETVDTQYNVAKLLWFFDCASQKSATSQVFQYLNNELVYSVGIDAKSAEFIEPVPETDVDIAMRYVCKTDKPITPAESKPVAIKPIIDKEKSASAKPEAEKAITPEVKPEPPAVKLPAVKPVSAKVANVSKPGTGKSSEHKPRWTYTGKEGPENWGKLSPEFATCDVGRNQSPINIEETARASLKPLKAIQKFAAKDIVNNGHTVQINFKEGNMLALDNAAFQMKQLHFHSPSENTIRGKAFPLEAHFVHTDSKGNLAVIGVMYTEGKANGALAKLWEQLPNEAGEPVELKNRVIPSDLIPENRGYYRFSGSLTTPPCSEGVRWLLMKSPLTASKEQIEAFKKAAHHDNNRPVQALNGRVIVE